MLAVQGGVTIDMSGMNRVLSINADDLSITVEPGISRMRAVKQALDPRNLMNPGKIFSWMP